MHCLRGQTRTWAIPVQIHCQYAGGAGAAALPPVHGRQPVQTSWNQVSTHITPFATYHHQYHTLSLPYHIFLLPITPFSWFILENLRYIAEKTL